MARLDISSKIRRFVLPMFVIYTVFGVGVVIPAVLAEGGPVWVLLPLGVWALLCTAGGVWLLGRVK